MHWRGPCPLPTAIPADGALRPQHLSMGSSWPVVCHPRLGGLPQSGCTGTQAFVIEPSGGGGGRRRRRCSPHHGSHRPHWSIGAMSDGADLHRSTGPTLRTTDAMDRHYAANLADTVPCHTSTAGTSFKQRRPFGHRYAARSKEYVRQLATPLVHPLLPPHPAKVNCLGRGTRWPGLADERPRKRGSGTEVQERVDTVQRRRRSPRGGAPHPAMARPSTSVRSSGASGLAKGTAAEHMWCPDSKTISNSSS
jgi:hypothetical protein